MPGFWRQTARKGAGQHERTSHEAKSVEGPRRARASTATLLARPDRSHAQLGSNLGSALAAFLGRGRPSDAPTRRSWEPSTKRATGRRARREQGARGRGATPSQDAAQERQYRAPGEVRRRRQGDRRLRQEGAGGFDRHGSEWPARATRRFPGFDRRTSRSPSSPSGGSWFDCLRVLPTADLR